MVNALAYFYTATITVIKGFIVQKPGFLNPFNIYLEILKLILALTVHYIRTQINVDAILQYDNMVFLP